MKGLWCKLELLRIWPNLPCRLRLATDGRADEAVEQTTLACQQDVLSPFIHGLTSLALYTLTRFHEAERIAHHALELQPGYLLGLWVHGMALCGLGRNEEAIKSFERAVTMSRVPLFVGLLGLVYVRAGRPATRRGYSTS